MVTIAISGSVGVGKTTIAKELSKKIKGDLIELNEMAKKFKIEDVPELQTFDFNLDALINNTNKIIANKKEKNLILEGHFSHYLNPSLVDFLIIINRNLQELQLVYKKRGYNEQKIKDNLEVESFNLCFYEGLEEGYKEEKQIRCFENNGNLDEIIENILNVISMRKE